MTLPGLLAFLGLAVVTVDVLGGVLAMGMLLRGATVRHLLAFATGYTVIVTAATMVLHPLLRWLGGWLRPVLASNDAIGAVEVVVGLALVGVGVHQLRASLKPRREHGPLEDRVMPTRLATVPLLLGGALFAGTTLADPAFTIAVGMASQEPHLSLRILLLVVWNLVYQTPLLAVLIAAAAGRHEQLVARVLELVTPHKKLLQRLLAAVLLAAGLAVLADGVVALLTQHVPWLRQLLLLR